MFRNIITAALALAGLEKTLKPAKLSFGGVTTAQHDQILQERRAAAERAMAEAVADGAEAIENSYNRACRSYIENIRALKRQLAQHQKALDAINRAAAFMGAEGGSPIPLCALLDAHQTALVLGGIDDSQRIALSTVPNSFEPTEDQLAAVRVTMD